MTQKQQQTVIRNTISAYVLEIFRVQPQLYNASSNFYKRSEEFAKPLREAGARCEADEARAQNRKNLEVP